MTKFADLCRDFDAWRTLYFENQVQSLNVARRVASEFRQHIGASETFRDPDGSSKPRVVLMSATDIGGGRVRYEEPAHFIDALSKWDDGFFHFAVGLYVEIAPNVWPKQCFPVPIYFVIEEKTCKMHVTNRPDGAFEFDIDATDGCAEMYNFMASFVSDIFKTKPWDVAGGKAKAKFGFVPTK
jgi:hypothetical protein